MAVVTIQINSKPFQIACNDGEEERVKNAASAISGKISDLKQSSPTASTELLLIMTALGLQDELKRMNEIVQRSKNPGEDEKVAETLTTIANYLETIAQKISK
ncbi:MAG: cell division protein ZapA [Rickettsiaceae bacterium]|nr:cell division protein ZapA [Rickettsiaceae bacterium]